MPMRAAARGCLDARGDWANAPWHTDPWVRFRFVCGKLGGGTNMRAAGGMPMDAHVSVCTEWLVVHSMTSHTGFWLRVEREVARR